MADIKSRKILNEIRDRFIDGEKLTTKDILNDYFSPKNPYAYLVAEKTIRGWTSSTKLWFKRTAGIWFGCLDNEGHYGVVSTAEEVVWAMTRYYRYIKGSVANAALLVSDAGNKKLLPKGMMQVKMLVATIEKEEKKEKEEKNGN